MTTPTPRTGSPLSEAVTQWATVTTSLDRTSVPADEIDEIESYWAEKIAFLWWLT